MRREVIFSVYPRTITNTNNPTKKYTLFENTVPIKIKHYYSK